MLIQWQPARTLRTPSKRCHPPWRQAWQDCSKSARILIQHWSCWIGWSQFASAIAHPRSSPPFAHYALVIFGYSRFLGETLLQNPDLLPSLLRERNLDQSFSREEFNESLARFRSRSFEADTALVLSRFKRREYIRIMLRDVLKLAPLAETTAEISALADVLIDNALRDAETPLQRKYGTPQRLDQQGRIVNTPFAILSLGKLGGNELNYSSDVDLMFIFGDGEEPAEAQISNREYFIRLAQQVTDIFVAADTGGSRLPH